MNNKKYINFLLPIHLLIFPNFSQSASLDPDIESKLYLGLEGSTGKVSSKDLEVKDNYYSLGVKFGYRFNNYLGIESTLSGAAGGFNLGNQGNFVEIESLVNLSAVAFYPISDKYRFITSLGMSRVSSKIVDKNNSTLEKASETSPSIGLGVSVLSGSMQEYRVMFEQKFSKDGTDIKALNFTTGWFY